jgi:hypothetical protein
MIGAPDAFDTLDGQDFVSMARLDQATASAAPSLPADCKSRRWECSAWNVPSIFKKSRGNERGRDFGLCALGLCRIGHAHMGGHWLSAPQRARFARRVVAKCEHKIEQGRADREIRSMTGAKARRVIGEILEQSDGFQDAPGLWDDLRRSRRGISRRPARSRLPLPIERAELPVHRNSTSYGWSAMRRL